MSITEKIKTVLHLKKEGTSYEKDETKLFHDWRNMLILEFIFLFLAGIVAFYFYVEISQGNLFTTPLNTSEVKVTINKNLLTKIIDEIATRASSTEALRTNTTPPDPSI